MAFESINLNLIPTGDAPVIHAAQYDIDRPLIINMYLGEDTFTPTDLDIELQVRKVDNNIVTAVPDSVDGNTITFLTTEQMTACSGSNLCSLKFTAGDNHIATLHFFLVVQRDVLQGGLTSQSEIHDLADQIAEIVPEVIGDEYYTAEQVDEKIAEIPTFDPTNYYDKTQLYTKTETNGLLSQKANTSSLSAVAFSGSYTDLNNTPTIPDVSNYYTKSETYNQTEVNNLLSTKADTSSLSTVATTGDYDDLLNKPTIPAAQVQSDWSQADNTKVDYIKNKPTIPAAQVQSDWSQADNTQVDYIKNKPTIIEYGKDLPMSTTDPDKVADRIEACETAISGKADISTPTQNLSCPRCPISSFESYKIQKIGNVIFFSADLNFGSTSESGMAYFSSALVDNADFVQGSFFDDLADTGYQIYKGRGGSLWIRNGNVGIAGSDLKNKTRMFLNLIIFKAT